MNAQLDPYLDWLQIPADRRPPTHYDLLGLPPFEGDAQRVQAAATERIAHVRKYQVGVHGELAIRVMGEVSRALTCLVDPASKRQYDAQLRGMATMADGETGLETVLQEPAENPPSEQDGYGIEPLPADLAGSAPNPGLDKLTALVDLTEPPPQAELQPAGLTAPAAATAQELVYGTVTKEVRPPEPAVDTNTKFLAIVGGVVAAAVLLMAMVGWMLSGSKKAGDADSPALAGDSTTDNSDPAGTTPANALTLAPGQQGQWTGTLVDLFLPTGGQLGQVHLLVRLPQASDAFVEAVANDPQLLVSLNEYLAELESGGQGDVVTIEGEVEDARAKTFGDATGPHVVRLQSIQRTGNAGSLAVVGNPPPRFAPLKIEDELTCLHRLRPPPGALVQFEALYQGIDPWAAPAEATAQLKAPGADARLVKLRFGDPAVRPLLDQHYRPGDRVMVQAAAVSGAHPAALELSGRWMEKPGQPESAIGTATAAARVAAVVQQWNDLTSPPAAGAGIDRDTAVAILSWPPKPAMPAIGMPAPAAPAATLPAAGPTQPDYAASERLWRELGAAPDAKIGQAVTLVGRFQGWSLGGTQSTAHINLLLGSNLAPLQTMLTPEAQKFLAGLAYDDPVEVHLLMLGGSAYQPRAALLAMSRFGQPATKIVFADRKSFATPLFAIGGGNDLPRQMAWSPDGTRLATLSDSCGLWDARTGKQLATVPGPFQTNIPPAFNVADTHLATVDVASQMKVWDARTLAEVTSQPNVRPSEGCLSFAMAKSGHLAAWITLDLAGPAPTGGYQVQIWDLQRVRLQQAIPQSPTDATCVAFRQDNTLAIGTTVGLYVSRTGPNGWLAPQVVNNSLYSVTLVEWLPGPSGWLSAMAAGNVTVWDPDNPNKGQLLAAPASEYGSRGMSWRRDGTRLVLITGGQLGFWHVAAATGKQLPQRRSGRPAAMPMGAGFPGAEMPQAINTDAPDAARVDPSGPGFSAVAYSPVNDYLATGSLTGQVVLWDEASGKQVLTMEVSTPVTALRWSPRGNRLASLHSDGRLMVWDVSQYSTPGPPVPAASTAPTTPAPPPPAEGVTQTAPVPTTPAADEGEAFQKALAAVDDAVDKLYKDKNATAARWQQVVAQLALVEQQAQSEPDQDAVKRMRRRLTNIADDRVDAAVRQRRNASLYYKFLTEAIAIDPQGPAGKKAQQMLNGGRRPGF